MCTGRSEGAFFYGAGEPSLDHLRVPAPGRTDAPDPALDLQFFYLFLDRPVGHASMLCNFRDGDRRVLAHEFDDFWGTFWGTFW